MLKRIITIILCGIFLIACREKPFNNPYPQDNAVSNTYYASFSQQPKTLDPTRSYSTDEALFTAQIYEPPLQYHYLLRPYTLIPLAAAEMPKVTYLDAQQKLLSADTQPEKIAYTVYEIHIKPHILYQPHPAFAKKSNGDFYYHQLKKLNYWDVSTLADFPQTGTRELTADDYVYEIKRMADSAVHCPIYSFLIQHIVDFDKLSDNLKQTRTKIGDDAFLDLRKFSFAGAQATDKYTYRIVLKGNYPQFSYWLTMPFFAPIPWEADYFYSQPGMRDNNLDFDWYPVGTGPYLLAENNPNRRMVLKRNPNFHGETYPTQGESQDLKKGLLNNAGKSLPFIDQYIFTLEKESIPRWTKFLQGYYDQSAIISDSFDQAITIDANSNPVLTPELKSKDIKLQINTSSSLFYLGFNMRDPVIGSLSEQACKLRQAISIAIDFEEYIAIFLNGRGLAAQGPLPPGIFGYQNGQQGINPYVYNWQDNHVQRKSIADAKKLLAEAGYPNGIDPKTQKPLLLTLDVATGGSADDKAYFVWLRKQFEKLGVELQINDTQYNRFQDRVRNGEAQMFFWGWNADYPDPENFLFLLYSVNSMASGGGENASNYSNPQYDKLFEQMRVLPNNPERLAIIQQMLAIARHDAPWVWGFNPQGFVLTQGWVSPIKYSDVANNTLKYIALDVQQRAVKQRQWNCIVWWPIATVIILFLISLIPVVIRYQYYKRLTYRQKHKGE